MKVIIVGGGAAGMIAAVFAARAGNNVTLVEKNEKLGKKVYITGKGRCNVTNACDDMDFFQNVITNPKFLYSAYYGFTSSDVMDFFEDLKLPLKIERGNRVFPVSDHSSDVIGALKRELNRLSVEILYNTKAESIITEIVDSEGIEKTIIKGISIISNGKRSRLLCDKLILATGGNSYKSTGSDGDTWKFANELGISSKNAEPSLVPLTVKEDYIVDLQGLSLKNVSVDITRNGKNIYSGFGEMLFTHFGLSGPLILSASTLIKEDYYKDEIKAFIDLKPSLSVQELDERVQKDFKKYNNKQFINALSDLLPNKLIPIIVRLSGIDERKQVNLVTKEERKKLVNLLKHMEFIVIGNRGFDEAIITRGGISVKEINPKTMESKKIKGLYFAGEMIDVDALTGGFNLQIAWSTGRLAAIS